MNQTQLMERYIKHDLNGAAMQSGNLHIIHDGGMGRLVYDGLEIAAGRLVWNDTGNTWDVDYILIAEKKYMQTAQYKATSKLLGIMDDMGYRNDGTMDIMFSMGHREQLMKANVYRHKESKAMKPKSATTPVVVDVRPLDEDDWQGLVEQARDAGSGNMEVIRMNTPGTYKVRILNDDGSLKMENLVTRTQLMRVMVCMGHFDLDAMLEGGLKEVILDLGQMDIWDTSNVFQIAAFGDVIIS